MHCQHRTTQRSALSTQLGLRTRSILLRRPFTEFFCVDQRSDSERGTIWFFLGFAIFRWTRLRYAPIWEMTQMSFLKFAKVVYMLPSSDEISWRVLVIHNMMEEGSSLSCLSIDYHLLAVIFLDFRSPTFTSFCHVKSYSTSGNRSQHWHWNILFTLVRGSCWQRSRVCNTVYWIDLSKKTFLFLPLHNLPVNYHLRRMVIWRTSQGGCLIENCAATHSVEFFHCFPRFLS